VFFQTPLGAVVDELNRYQRGRIMILSDRLRALPVTGVFSTRHAAEAIDIIKATLGVSSFRVTDAVIVLR
jgi:transmembrane sensor